MKLQNFFIDLSISFDYVQFKFVRSRDRFIRKIIVSRDPRGFKFEEVQPPYIGAISSAYIPKTRDASTRIDQANPRLEKRNPLGASQSTKTKRIAKMI